MKKIVYSIFALGCIAASLTSCDDAKNDVIDNMIYISEAASESSSEVVLSSSGTTSTTNINVRMAQKAVVDTKVKIDMSQAVLDTYNRRNQTEFQMIPEQYVSFQREVVIPAGSSMVEVPVHITSFDGEAGVEYAAPLTIVSAEGQTISEGSRSFIITFGKVLTQKAPGFISSNAMTVPWPETVETDGLTLEWWVRCTNAAGTGGYSINNQAMFSFSANKEIYVRFGDIVYTVNGRSVYNFLQIKTMGIDANYDSGDPNKNPLQWGEWYHFAHTYDPATGDVVLYQNGVEVNRSNGGAGFHWEINGLNMCSAGSYHRDVIEMAQVRLWKTTRTAAQIQKNFKKEVKYNDPNLIFYFPMNEGEGSILHDVTGNGHDITIGSNTNGGNNQAKSWNEVSFN